MATILPCWFSTVSVGGSLLTVFFCFFRILMQLQQPPEEVKRPQRKRANWATCFLVHLYRYM
ncbi:hypothetical protein CW304_10015 [Bacillus sp. UFRGS-B20]|nr:hypothetical protein CW304_10015 [Bacillus sp. UFRGS-B20]